MAFDINKANSLSTTTPRKSVGFDVEKANNFGKSVDTPRVSQPLKVNVAVDAIKAQQVEKKSVRLPFSERKVELSGLNNPVTRGAANIVWRSMEDIVVGGLKVAATAKGGNIETRPITNEPFLSNGEPITQTTFEPMSRAALNRINDLDALRPDKSKLNLIQGATEEVFLPLLNAVDIIGLGSLTVRLARKATMSKSALEAYASLNMGLLSDTSETGVRTHITGEIKKNMDLLAAGKITPVVFEKRINVIGEAFDTLTEAPVTKLGPLGERINRLATALEANRSIGRSLDPSLVEAKAALKDAFSNISRKVKVSSEGGTRSVKITPPLKVSSDAVTTNIPIKTPATRKAAYDAARGVEKYTPDSDLPVIDFGKKPKSNSDLPSIDIDTGKVTPASKVVVKDFDLTDNKITASTTGFKAVKLTGPKEVMNIADLAPDLRKEYLSAFRTKAAARGTAGEAQAVKVFQEVVNTIAKKLDIPDVNTPAKKVVVNAPAKKVEADTTAKKNEAEAPSSDGRAKSVLAMRINKTLPGGSKLDEYYDTITIKGEIDKAGKAIEKNPTKALSEALDGGKPVGERAARLMEFAQNAKNRGDVSVQSALLSKMRVLGTEIAQGLNIFKAFGFTNPETDFMHSVVEARLRKVTITDEDISRAGTPNRAYNEKVYAPVREEINRVTNKAFKVQDAQKLFDELTC